MNNHSYTLLKQSNWYYLEATAWGASSAASKRGKFSLLSELSNIVCYLYLRSCIHEYRNGIDFSALIASKLRIQAK